MAEAMLQQQRVMREVATWEIEVGDVMWEMARMVSEDDYEDLQL